MKRLHVLVEGQTEEVFVRDVLAPHLQEFGTFTTAIIVATKRVRAGGKCRGGVTSWTQVERQLRLLLGDSDVVGVTTMLDLYGLPSGWPGLPGLRRTHIAR
ncbi:MAG: DUF4276 family protein [Acidimicrobiia bacterium]|nr:DUF4276 family protein [Acidimicrobiia bacterium]